MKTITIHTAAIEHRHGTNIYSSLSNKEIRRDIAAYCKDEWENEMGEEPMPKSAEKRIEMYFELVENEYLTTGEHTIDLPNPYAAASSMLKALLFVEKRLARSGYPDGPILQTLRKAITEAA